MKEVLNTELPEDIEVIGPGQLLADARAKLNLSIEQVAHRLNFRVCQILDIEADSYDGSVPETFTRGYLLNYAKLVGVDSKDIISSYESLDVARKQCAQMQSFSKITEKQAAHSRLMWLSYFIIFALIASSVLYYIQESRQQHATTTVSISTAPVMNETEVEPLASSSDVNSSADKTGAINTQMDSSALVAHAEENINSNASTLTPNTAVLAGELINVTAAEQPVQVSADIENTTQIAEVERPINSQAIFTFAGDCWVNIHDAKGERIAYGVKKSGYVMELNGIAPFKVTVGKPELVSITLNGERVDMAKYKVGNIAKFTLPENS